MKRPKKRFPKDGFVVTYVRLKYMKLLKFFVIALFTITFVSASVAQTEKRASIKTKPPKKEWIEKEFKKISVEELSRSNCFNNEGEKIVCPCLTGESVCYKKGDMSVTVKYGKKNKAREILINYRSYEGYKAAVKLIFGEFTKENLEKLSNLLQPDSATAKPDPDIFARRWFYENKRILVEQFRDVSMRASINESFRIVWK